MATGGERQVRSEARHTEVMLWGAHCWDFNRLHQGTETWSRTRVGRVVGGRWGAEPPQPAWELSF